MDNLRPIHRGLDVILSINDNSFNIYDINAIPGILANVVIVIISPVNIL